MDKRLSIKYSEKEPKPLDPMYRALIILGACLICAIAITTMGLVGVLATWAAALIYRPTRPWAVNIAYLAVAAAVVISGLLWMQG